MIQERAWYDVALLAYVALFFALESILLIRETRLGWAMLSKCLALGVLFGYAAFYTIAYGTIIWCWCLIGDPIVMALRVFIAVALTWAIAEMLRGNIHHRERWP
jgi:hypothetical protein